jgi:hypothetical protein
MNLLTHLDQMTIRVADVGADLASVVLRLRQEVRAFGTALDAACVVSADDPEVVPGPVRVDEHIMIDTMARSYCRRLRQGARMVTEPMGSNGHGRAEVAR